MSAALYFTPRARPWDTPDVFARALAAELLRATALARRARLRPTCAEAFARGRAAGAGG